MTVYYHTGDDTALIALRGGVGPGEAVTVDIAFNGKLAFYLDKAGYLIGVELRDIDLLHPDLARGVIQMRPIEEGDV
jgi:hypothetical protein